MERELIINGKKLKELVSSALKTKYENISFEFNNEEDFAVEIKYGHFKEYISFSDERTIWREFRIQNYSPDQQCSITCLSKALPAAVSGKLYFSCL